MMNDECVYDVSDDDCDKCLKHHHWRCPLPCPDYKPRYDDIKEQELEERRRRDLHDSM